MIYSTGRSNTNRGGEIKEMGGNVRWLCVLLVCVKLVTGDLYLHNPRGSNDRLNENTATRTNANRLFDSQVSFEIQQQTNK